MILANEYSNFEHLSNPSTDAKHKNINGWPKLLLFINQTNYFTWGLFTTLFLQSWQDCFWKFLQDIEKLWEIHNFIFPKFVKVVKISPVNKGGYGSCYSNYSTTGTSCQAHPMMMLSQVAATSGRWALFGMFVCIREHPQTTEGMGRV